MQSATALFLSQTAALEPGTKAVVFFANWSNCESHREIRFEVQPLHLTETQAVVTRTTKQIRSDPFPLSQSIPVQANPLVWSRPKVSAKHTDTRVWLVNRHLSIISSSNYLTCGYQLVKSRTTLQQPPPSLLIPIPSLHLVVVVRLPLSLLFSMMNPCPVCPRMKHHPSLQSLPLTRQN
jgi:hypothetical protein